MEKPKAATLGFPIFFHCAEHAAHSGSKARFQQSSCVAPLGLAFRLDREADALIGLGFIAQAERLAHKAAELRGAT